MAKTRVFTKLLFCLLIVQKAPPFLLGQAPGARIAYFSQVVLNSNSTTSFTIHNPSTTEPITVSVQVYTPEGEPLDEETVEIGAGGTRVVVFGNPEAALTNGWAVIAAEGEFVAAGFFQIFLGTLLPKVGVLPSVASQEALLFAVNGESRTGVAVSNPNDSVATIRFDFRNNDGEVALCDGEDFGTIQLQPLHQRAFFLDQLCEGLADFQGTVSVTAPLPVAVLSLIQNTTDGVVTTVPVTVSNALNTDTIVTNRNELFIGSDQDSNEMESVLRLGTDATPLLSLYEGGGVVVQDRDLLVTSPIERALRVQRVGEDGSEFENAPTFSLGRIVTGGDGSPEFRAVYSDSSPQGFERSVFEFDNKGIVSSVKPTLSEDRSLNLGSHFEGFIQNEVEPLFRLNSFPSMQLELGAGGSAPPDVALRREDENGQGAFSILTGGNERVRVTAQGNVGIGVISPVANLQVEGTGFFSGGVTSSREVKENISSLTIDQALRALEGLEPTQFTYKGDPNRDLQIGFIAEDVPDILSTPGRKGVQPMDVVAVLTKVLQHQQRLLYALQDQVERLREGGR